MAQLATLALIAISITDETTRNQYDKNLITSQITVTFNHPTNVLIFMH